MSNFNTPRVFVEAKPRTRRTASNKPSIVVKANNGITVVRFNYKPDPTIRARLLAHDFAWDYASGKWTLLGEMPQADVFAIVRGDCQCSQCKGWWTK
jgi:hypothetical protein